MGYTTEFEGSLKFSRPLTEKEQIYINMFSETRRIRRDVNKLMKNYNGDFGNPYPENNTPESIYGVDGEYFCGDEIPNDDTIINYNYHPRTQPGLYCQWVTDDEYLFWDGGEKFYDYVEWLRYLINHFFSKWGIQLNGEIKWRGEDFNDFGKIIVTDNNIKTETIDF